MVGWIPLITLMNNVSSASLSFHITKDVIDVNIMMSSMYCKYSKHMLNSCGKIYVSSNLPINRLAYAG